MKTYLKIKPINLGGLFTDVIVNAISWKCFELERNAKTAKITCTLHNIDFSDENLDNTQFYNTNVYHAFSIDLPEDVLQSWGEDDSVIDEFVLQYSPKFVKA